MWLLGWPFGAQGKARIVRSCGVDEKFGRVEKCDLFG